MAKQTNREILEAEAKELDLEIGCYNNKVDKLTKKELNKVLENMEFQADTDVFLNRRLHVVEIDIVDSEIDFNILSQSEYVGRYGDERWRD